MTRCLSIAIALRLGLALGLGLALMVTPLAEGSGSGAKHESVQGSRQTEKSARRRELERRQAEAARQRAEMHRRHEARRAAETQAREQARLRAEDGRRRAAARARIRELDHGLAIRQRRAKGPNPAIRSQKARPGPSLRTLRRNRYAAAGIDRVPSARHFRVHYDAGDCTAHYLTTINRLRYRRGAGDQRPVFDPLRPYSGVVDVPAGVWTNR